MQKKALQKLIQKIQKTKTESPVIEVKAAQYDCPTRLYDTLSSFSNQDSGGTIIFGMDEKSGFSVCGVYDPQDLQKKITEQCKQMEPVVRPLFTLCAVGEKTVVSAEIPGVDIANRPVFYKGTGRVKGSYIRIGDADEPMTEAEVYSFEAYRRGTRADLRTVEIKVPLPNRERLQDYLLAVKRDRPNLAQNVPDADILELMGVTMDRKPTLAGLLTFSRYPQSYFPQFSITAVSVPGTEIGVVGSEGERFIDNKRLTGAIPDMLEAAVDFVYRNSRIKTIINERGKRVDKEEYPLTAVREAVLNALVHRDYSVYSENSPVRIEMFRDRLEITSPGGLWGHLTVDVLGQGHPETRNPTLTNLLELLKVMENRFSGIPTMRAKFREAGLPAPEFKIVHGEFKVIMKNGYATEDHTDSVAILGFCEAPRSRQELVAFTGKSYAYTMNTLVKPLLESGQLKLTMPDKPKSSYQRFVKA